MQYSYQAINQSSSIGTSGISNLSSSIVLLITETGEGMGSQGNNNSLVIESNDKNKKKQKNTWTNKSSSTFDEFRDASLQ